MLPNYYCNIQNKWEIIEFVNTLTNCFVQQNNGNHIFLSILKYQNIVS